MSEPKIRQAEERDIEDFRRIAMDAWRPIHAYYREAMGEDLYAREIPDEPLVRKADSIESFFRAHPEWIFITELDGKVVGFCTYRLGENGVGEIGNNGVDPSAQGHGIGGAQYDECLRRMREAGMVHAKVGTGLDPAHAPARRAYEKVGFKQIRPHVEFYMKL